MQSVLLAELHVEQGEEHTICVQIVGPVLLYPLSQLHVPVDGVTKKFSPVSHNTQSVLLTELHVEQGEVQSVHVVEFALKYPLAQSQVPVFGVAKKFSPVSHKLQSVLLAELHVVQGDIQFYVQVGPVLVYPV